MNITNVLQKCIDSLTSDKPDLSYVKGMLETVIEMTTQPVQMSITPNSPIPHGTTQQVVTVDEDPTEASTRAYLGGNTGDVG